jgi:hypothetical protein
MVNENRNMTGFRYCLTKKDVNYFISGERKKIYTDIVCGPYRIFYLLGVWKSGVTFLEAITYSQKTGVLNYGIGMRRYRREAMEKYLEKYGIKWT